MQDISLQPYVINTESKYLSMLKYITQVVQPNSVIRN